MAKRKRPRAGVPTAKGEEFQPVSPPTPNGGDRDSRGRFAPGNPGGPGNPFASRVLLYKRAFYDALEPDHIAAVARAVVRAAISGDVSAQKLALAYGIGKPVTQVEVSGGLGAEISTEGSARDAAAKLRALIAQELAAASRGEGPGEPV